MNYARVSLQAYIRSTRTNKAVRGETWTWNGPERTEPLNLPQVATGMVAALVQLWCAAHGLELDDARKVLGEVQAGIATLNFAPVEGETS